MANSVARPSPRGRLQPGKGSVICQIAPLASLGVDPQIQLQLDEGDYQRVMVSVEFHFEPTLD
jgi:hypothetical protein